MSIELYVKDADLATMLRLEARRQGFDRPNAPALILVDLDTHTAIPKKENALTVGFSRQAKELEEKTTSGVHAVLSLPFSVSELEHVLQNAFVLHPKTQVQRDKNTLLIGGSSIRLSNTEGRLFDLLYQNRHRLVSYRELHDALGDSAQRTNTLSVYLYRLRRKLCRDGVSRILTKRALGCRWVGEE